MYSMETSKDLVGEKNVVKFAEIGQMGSCCVDCEACKPRVGSAAEVCWKSASRPLRTPIPGSQSETGLGAGRYGEHDAEESSTTRID